MRIRRLRAGRAAIGALAGVAVMGAILAGNGEALATRRASEWSEDSVERGRYLVSTHGCDGCHTPLTRGPKGPHADKSRRLSGHPEGVELSAPPAPSGDWILAGDRTNTAFAGPWGISYAANLTPDVNTGLGIWTEQMFVNAIRTGKHFGVSRPIQPPMPWSAFRNLTDSDLKAIYAYLRSIPPVTNHVPDYEPPKEGAIASD
jgi:hypothetical protein